MQYIMHYSSSRDQVLPFKCLYHCASPLRPAKARARAVLSYGSARCRLLCEKLSLSTHYQQTRLSAVSSNSARRVAAASNGLSSLRGSAFCPGLLLTFKNELRKCKWEPRVRWSKMTKSQGSYVITLTNLQELFFLCNILFPV